jgi:hypothetical protein
MIFQYRLGSPGDNPWLDVIREVRQAAGNPDNSACGFGMCQLVESSDGGDLVVEVYRGAVVLQQRSTGTARIVALTMKSEDEVAAADQIVKHRQAQNAAK